jgi:hypothetical protein
MKFFLVISIIAIWWVPMNSPGNIGISNTSLSAVLPKAAPSNISTAQSGFMTKRKMDHFGFRVRKHLIAKETNLYGGK